MAFLHGAPSGATSPSERTASALALSSSPALSPVLGGVDARNRQLVRVVTQMTSGTGIMNLTVIAARVLVGPRRPDRRRGPPFGIAPGRLLVLYAVGLHSSAGLGRVARRLAAESAGGRAGSQAVQAGYPYGLDLPRILGIKIIMAPWGQRSYLCLIGPATFRARHGWRAVLPARLLGAEHAGHRQARCRPRPPTRWTIDDLCRGRARLRRRLALWRRRRKVRSPTSSASTISDIQAGVPRPGAAHHWPTGPRSQRSGQLVTACPSAEAQHPAARLRIQSAEIVRKQRTEEKATKLTVKMLFPIVFCFMPTVVVHHGGPEHSPSLAKSF